MRHFSPSFAQRGLTLTETVTAFALLGIGVLCIATVYLERTQAAPAVLVHSKASRLAAEMAERMKSYRNGGVHFDHPVGVRCDPRITAAAPQRMATNDIACWQEKVARTLPNGSGAIAHDSNSTPPAYLITVSWTPGGRGTASYLLRVGDPEATAAPQPAAVAALP